MSGNSVSVHIVNWNGGTDIVRCLESVYAQTYHGIREIVVVDNGSTDGSLLIIEKKFPRIKLIRNDFNLGFCKAHNQAIRISEADFVLLLNFDVFLEPGFTSEMLQAVTADERIGMVSGKLYRNEGGGGTQTLDSTGFAMRHYFSTPRGEGMEDSGQFDDIAHRTIFGPCGAAPLYRRAMLEDIRCGGEYFDEDFVNYVEDVDLAWRAQLRGWKAVYAPPAVAYHERGATRKTNLAEQHNYYWRGFRNRYLAMYKNITKEEWKRTRFKIISRELLFLLQPNDDKLTESVRWKALREALRLKKLFAEKRAFIQSRVGIPPTELFRFFEYENFNFFYFLWAQIKGLVYNFLCRSNWGKDLIARYRSLKHKNPST